MLTFETHNTDDSINVNMTCLQGHYQIPKKKLVEFFGEPMHGDDKVINEWHIEIMDENYDLTVVTIYDWKNYGTDELSDNYSNWHIGGFGVEAIYKLTELLEQLLKG